MVTKAREELRSYETWRAGAAEGLATRKISITKGAIYNQLRGG